MRLPTRRTFGQLADQFEEVTLAARPRKKSTLIDYRPTLKNHLRPAFATLDLERLSRSPETVERYAAAKIADGPAPKTVRNHLALLGLMFRQARKWRWVSDNPPELVDPPEASEPDGDTHRGGGASTTRRVPAARRRRRRRRSAVVRRGPTNDRRRALNRIASWGDPRASLVGRRAARQAVAGTPGVRPWRDDYAKVAGWPTRRASGPERSRRSRISFGRAATGPPRASCSATARSVRRSTRRTDVVRPTRVRGGCDHETVPAAARPSPHCADRDGRGRGAGHVRARKGRSRAGDDDRAVPARDDDAFPDAAELAEARLFADQ